jgi:transposase
VRLLWAPEGERMSPVDVDLTDAELGVKAAFTVTDRESISRLEGLTRHAAVSAGAAPDPMRADDDENLTDEVVPSLPVELLVSDQGMEDLAEAQAAEAVTSAQTDDERLVLDRLVPTKHPLRQLRAALTPELVERFLQEFQSAEWPARASFDPEQMFRLYVLQTIYGHETEAELMMEAHVNRAYRWFCGFGVSEEIWEGRALSEFRNALRQRLFVSIANGLLAQAGSAVEAARPRSRLRRQAR